jgi:hypothetical protein
MNHHNSGLSFRKDVQSDFDHPSVSMPGYIPAFTRLTSVHQRELKKMLECVEGAASTSPNSSLRIYARSLAEYYREWLAFAARHRFTFEQEMAIMEAKHPATDESTARKRLKRIQESHR